MITPIQASKAADAVRSPQVSSGASRVGAVVEAQVISVGPNGQVQLSVNGSPLNIRSATPLVPGTSISLVVNRGADGGVVLKLLAPEAANGPAPAPAASQVSASAVARSTQTLQGALVGLGDTLSAARSPASSSVTASSTVSAASTDAFAASSSDIAALARHIDLHASASRHVAGLGSGNAATAGGHNSSSAGQDSGSGSATSSRAASSPAEVNNAASTASATVYTFSLPGLSAPVRFTVSSEEGSRSGVRSEAAQGNAVTARFTVVSDRLGPVHAVLRQADGAVSVGLWAERRESATALQQDRGQLNAKLRDADIPVGTLDIFSGRPAG